MALVMAPTLRIRLLGEFNLTWPTSETEAPVATLNTPRPQSLLAYLVLHRDAPQSRRHLVFCLWPDLREECTRANLRKLFYQLQRALPERARQHERLTLCRRHVKKKRCGRPTWSGCPPSFKSAAGSNARTASWRRLASEW